MRIKIVVILGVLILILSCNSNYKQEDIIKYINTNKTSFMHNGLKGIEAMNLWKEQEKFYNDRIEYFISVLSNDKIGKEKYYNSERDYFDKFSGKNIKYFFWSRDIIDMQIVKAINDKYKDFQLPIYIMHEFERNTPKLFYD
jgi:hypothetical protein